MSRYVLSPDALLRRAGDGFVLSNPRTRTHVELSDESLPAVFELAAGGDPEAWSAALAAAEGWDRTSLAVASGLWSDHTGLGTRRSETARRGAALFDVLRRRMIVHLEDRSDYDAFLAPLTSMLDRKHLGTFHERVGQFLTLELRREEKWRWWHDQKFAEDGLSVRPGPYRFVQEHFFDRYYAGRSVRGKTVLDFACGNGYYSNKFAALGATVIGVDTDRRLIDLAIRNFGARATFHAPETNAESLALMASFPEGSVDLIYMSDVMLLLVDAAVRGDGKDDLTALLRAFRRLLPTGGRIQMMEPNSQFWLGGIYGDPRRPYTVVPEYRRRMFDVAPTIDEYVAVLADAGFGLVELLHPDVDPAAPDAALVARATEFPLWDFMTFVPLP